MTWVTLRTRDIRFLGSGPAWIRSSDRAWRGFCPACASVLAMRYAGEDEVSLALGSFDVPPAVRADGHIWAKERLPLAATVDADLPVWPEDGPD